MQSLLGQRGPDRKEILKKSGLPRWTKLATDYALELDFTVRTRAVTNVPTAWQTAVLL
jgi:hypothetical protein